MTSERCASFRDDLAAYRAGALDLARHAEQETHATACTECAAALAADAGLDDLLGELPSLDMNAGTARLVATAQALTAPAPPAPQPWPWLWIVAVGFALALALTADWGQSDPKPARPRDPWRYHAPPGLDRDALPLDTTDQPMPGELTWRVP